MKDRSQDSWLMGVQPPGGLLRGFASLSMPQFLKVVLPLTAVFLLAFALEYRAEVRAERARLLAQEIVGIERSAGRVEREIEVAGSDLRLLADFVSEEIAAEAPERLAAFERIALAFVRRRPDYFQVRFIGATGRELVDVENAPDGPRITPRAELQDKGDRSYFERGMRLEAGDVFVSPMDLNVERGVIEEPYRPVLRFVTPIDDAAGRRRGLVVLNVHGGHFLREFERNADESGIQRMIVNSDGYWLQHRPDVEWGFVLDHGRSFRSTFPEVWEQFVSRPQGGIESTEGLFRFESVMPQRVVSSGGAEAAEASHWMLISLVPRRLLDEIAVQIATPLLVIAMPTYFMLLMIAWLVAADIRRRKLADEALWSLEEVRSAMMRAALDGIVVMDESGITLEFNPSAQRIFGYTREEVRGRLVADLIIPPAHRETHRLGLEHYLATGEGRIIDKHIDELTAIRKNGEEFPVELTVCPVTVTGRHLFCGFLRDLSEPHHGEAEAQGQEAPS